MSFAEHPKSVKELRANQTDYSKDWDPRDVLINTLRDLDSGQIAPDALVIAFCEDCRTTYRASGGAIETIGLMSKALAMMTREP